MAPDAADVTVGTVEALPPLDGRDISRLRTEVRLAQLAVRGLWSEEEPIKSSPPGVIDLLDEVYDVLQDAEEKLGQALAILTEEAG